MAYILDLIHWQIKNPQEFQAQKKIFAAYLEYLSGLGDRLPKTIRDFVLTDWYWDAQSHQCPHDAWVESVEIRESATGERQEIRGIEIGVRLLGPYHDGHIEYVYREVKNYSLSLPATGRRRPRTGHDDWLADEVRLGQENRVVHEILFASGGRWLIECHEIEYKWLPAVAPTGPFEPS